MLYPLTPSPRRNENNTTGKTVYNTQAIQNAIQFLQDENWNKGTIYMIDIAPDGTGKAFVRYGNGSVDVRPFRVVASGLVNYYGKTARLDRFGGGLRYS